MPRETTPGSEQQTAAQVHQLITTVETFREDYIRGYIVDAVDHRNQPFRGAVRHLRLVGDLMPSIAPLIESAGGRIGFGNTGFIGRILEYELEIGQNEEGEIGLRHSLASDRMTPTPLISTPEDLKLARELDPGAVKAFGLLTGLDILYKYADFARGVARAETRRLAIPSSSKGGLPWV